MNTKLWLCCAIVTLCTITTNTFAFQSAQEVKSSQRLFASMDTLFAPATNSDGFMIIKSKDLEQLKKKILTEFNSLETEIRQINTQMKDSTQENRSKVEQMPTASTEASGTEEEAFDQLFLILLGVFLISCLILIIVYVSNLKKVKESQTRLVDLENEFADYKSNMIDRERKLMRDLIDARKLE